MKLLSIFALGLFCGSSLAAEPAPWAAYRGNPQRTGNTDNQPGPAKPTVLWSLKSQDHFVASPVAIGDKFYISGLGGFNRPTIALYPFTKPEPIWSKSAPYLKLASVSSPAYDAEHKVLVLGDGMHQDAGGLLHCLDAATGRPLWELPLPGDLNHLEGGPTILGGKVYIGGGAAGALCVQLDRATLDGKELSLAEIAKKQDAKWKELLAQYEVQKKKDPDFAIPPNDDMLLKPAPKKVWQVGQGKWHVDAPINAIGDRILVPTSFLEKEKVGERALYCLNAATGETLWKADLALNPWGGASVAGSTVIVPGSTIGYYFNEVKSGKGSLAAFDLATGKPKWKKDVPGGVVGCVAIADGLAVCTATDGKVRAYRIADGDRAWIYDAKYNIFAPPAIAGGVVYIADLQGTVHAIDLKTGAPKWALPLAKDAAVAAPGMVYGGVIVHGGKIVVATCNLEGPNARKPTAIAVIGSK
ncbi:MAG TPA: PQQ-binding-like beta-propeller repeat protein [Urbifossiella sp.]|nr:PQQ-binding-like beta-propeller repeat protein [Urbifossiella sp.]